MAGKEKYKRTKISSTPRQTKTAMNIVRNLEKTKPDPLNKVLVESGYSETSARHPKIVLQSQGFKALFESVGLTPEFIIQALHDDIRSKRGKREPELRLAGKWLGLETTTQETNVPELKITVEETHIVRDVEVNNGSIEP